MTSKNAPQRCIMLATDLSARSDRALDRAVGLAAQRQARLIVLHVYEPALADRLAPPDPRRDPDRQLALAQRRLARDLGEASPQVEIVVDKGKPVERIRAAAEERGCELIVTGVARDETLGRVLLGSTVERLVRESTIPVLVVKNRPHRPYAGALAATDFSDGSRAAVRAALRLLPEAPLKLYHAYDLPVGAGTKGSAPREARAQAEHEAERFLAGMPELSGWSRDGLVMEEGQPEAALNEYVFLNDVELVVVGTHGRTGILRTAMGSVAERLLQTLPCDVMIVRQPGDAQD